MSPIKVYLTEEEISNLVPGRYYIEVRVKIPTVIMNFDNDLPFIPPSLDPGNSPYHSSPSVALSETCSAIFDLTDHPQCPTEHTVSAADRFLNDYYPELDRVLREYLQNSEF
ncbi:MAG TPA: hypothetical protein VH186_23180 [Chloroflexia bacterium]|nr:hypothetical protein [Chloroflexia bacterium]